MTPIRFFACVITFFVALAFWAGATTSILYGMLHQADYPHDFNPYTNFGGLALFPTAVFTILAIITWVDTIGKTDRKALK